MRLRGPAIVRNTVLSLRALRCQLDAPAALRRPAKVCNGPIRSSEVILALTPAEAGALRSELEATRRNTPCPYLGAVLQKLDVEQRVASSLRMADAYAVAQ